MAPSTRRRGKPQGVAPVKFFTEYPTYDEQYFAEDILLANQPVIGEPSLEMLRFHRYITFRVGPELAVHHVNTEKLFNQSTYGKELCSRMTKIPSGCLYRVDFPDEDEKVFINFLEWINHGLYLIYKDSFRGSFIRHLKLYILALKYGIDGLAQFTFKVITDMLVESHPEQITRAPFWPIVVNLVYKCTAVGNEMRSVVTGYTLWYLHNGRAKLFETKTGTVADALLALKSLPPTSPFYRIDCMILHENPEYFEDKLDGYFGGTRNANSNTTRWWKESIEDPLFQTWMAYSKKVEGQGQMPSYSGWVNFGGGVDTVKGVDDEDGALFGGYEEKEAEAKNGNTKGGKNKSRSRVVKSILRAKATKPKERKIPISKIKLIVKTPSVIQEKPRQIRIKLIVNHPSVVKSKPNYSETTPGLAPEISEGSSATRLSKLLPDSLSSLNTPGKTLQNPLYSIKGSGVGCSTMHREESGANLRGHQTEPTHTITNTAGRTEELKSLKEERQLTQTLAVHLKRIVQLEDTRVFSVERVEIGRLLEARDELVELAANAPKRLAELEKRKASCMQMVEEVKFMQIKEELVRMPGLIENYKKSTAGLVDFRERAMARIELVKLERKKKALEYLEEKTAPDSDEGPEKKRARYYRDLLIQ